GALKNAINALVDQGRNRFVLNLEGVPYGDSSGLGEIASAHVTVSRTGGTLLLAAVNDRVMEALTITKLMRVLAAAPSEADALAKLVSGGRVVCRRISSQQPSPRQLVGRRPT